jgi:hypothetical protein
MNKKFVAFLIPLLVMPLFAFGYAHFTDEVVKKYKLHVGSVYLNVTGFHVDAVRMPDVNQDNVLWHIPAQAGDELNITIYNGTDCRTYVEITANPISGGFYLNTTMWMHNGGKLPFELDWNVYWDGPYPTDPCFGPPAPTKLISTLPLYPNGPWSWKMELYKWHKNAVTGEYERTGPWEPTQTHYKPCDYIQVIQHVDFHQPNPADPNTANWQKDWQCKWIKIWVTFHAQDVYMDASSWTWGTLGTPAP